MPRLVRRRPIFVRFKDFFNIEDWLLWISEELGTREWDTQQFGYTIAFVSHSLSLIALANVGTSEGSGDDVFVDSHSGTGWLKYIATVIIYLLTLLSFLNALYIFSRTRHYRMFEKKSIDHTPSTPSASRVKVNSSPVSSSPLRSFINVLQDQSAHPPAQADATSDVWELAVWDPSPVSLRLFCLFSPGHILVYWLFLPTGDWDPHPSVTLLKTIGLQILISTQLLLLQVNFAQQGRDSSVIQREVMHEYDTKFVHPRFNPLVRDVAIQLGKAETEDPSEKLDTLITYVPTFIIKRDFQTRPNLNYSSHFNPESKPPFSQAQESLRSEITDLKPNSPNSLTTSILTPHLTPRKLHLRRTVVSGGTASKRSDGGSLGVYSHANSPLRKAASLQDIQPRTHEMPQNSFHMASREVWEQRRRSMSPEKRLGEIKRAPTTRSNLSDDLVGKPSRMNIHSSSGPKLRPDPERFNGRRPF
ncbi:hypothetical protein K3495_g8156 [Podosphaera aphanis]|nr:hypothetical protein K3495_g8156 [Podosphaera aphanis]